MWALPGPRACPTGKTKGQGEKKTETAEKRDRTVELGDHHVVGEIITFEKLRNMQENWSFPNKNTPDMIKLYDKYNV